MSIPEGRQTDNVSNRMHLKFCEFQNYQNIMSLQALQSKFNSRIHSLSVSFSIRIAKGKIILICECVLVPHRSCAHHKIKFDMWKFLKTEMLFFVVVLLLSFAFHIASSIDRLTKQFLFHSISLTWQSYNFLLFGYRFSSFFLFPHPHPSVNAKSLLYRFHIK